MESISFSYNYDETERANRLNAMINDTYDAYLASLYISDPCTEFERYLRGNGHGQTRVKSDRKYETTGK
jgi:hypothetical protein